MHKYKLHPCNHHILSSSLFSFKQLGKSMSGNSKFLQQIFTDAATTKSDGIANKEDEQSYFELLWESVNSRYLKNITILMDERGPSTNVCSKEEKIHTLVMKTVTTPPHQMTNPLHGLTLV